MKWLGVAQTVLTVAVLFLLVIVLYQLATR